MGVETNDKAMATIFEALLLLRKSICADIDEAMRVVSGIAPDSGSAPKPTIETVCVPGCSAIAAIKIPNKTYAIGKYPVTQEQYENVMGVNPSHLKGAKNPVEMVTWNDAQAFCKVLSATSGWIVRLLTEAEWEHACRAGTTTNFYSGDSDADLYAAGWHRGNSCGKTHPVGEKKPNAFGLYDMHGNVWEWCEDKYSAEGAARVLRGGSWCNSPEYCRSASRDAFNPDDQSNHIGFRVALVPSSRTS